MSITDVRVLRAIGARPTGMRVEIPKYMRTEIVRAYSTNGIHVSRTLQRDLSFQNLAATLLEVNDLPRYRR